MITVALIGILLSVGPNLLLNMVRYFRLQMARGQVQSHARTSLELVTRYLRQASASTVVISQRDNQPPYSWMTFNIDKGSGEALGQHGFFQEGTNLYYMHDNSTSTIADNLRYIAFTYPRTDDDDIISISMTFEEETYAGYKKALQLSTEKVRVMNP
jgi:hypothetical protein